MSHGNRLDDSILYEPDAVDVGILLFGRRACSRCGLELAACTDYYQPDARAPDGMRTTCRRCRREQQRDGERVRDLAKAAS
jgi:hypothetical protein